MRLCRFAILCTIFALALIGPRADAQASTTTILTLTNAAGLPVGNVPSHSVVTLNATVSSSGSVAAPGQVNFCDATASFCTGTHLVGSAQLRADGRAVYRFTPGSGIHSYKAVFAGTNSYASSTSIATALVVLGGNSGVSAVGIQASGGQGDYTLLGTVAPAGTVSPTGQVTFLDTSNANYQLGAASLTPTGAANPSFLQSYSYQFSVGNGGRPGFVATGDFNNDGNQDVLFVSYILQAAYVLLGKGDGTFNALSFPLAGAAPSEPPVVADLNSDGNLDFVVRTKTGIAVFMGNGDGTFTAGPVVSRPILSTFFVADFNGDGIPDLLLSDGSDRTF